MRNTFKVYERLKKEQQINTLFHSGKAFSVFPLRFMYNIVSRTNERDTPVKAGFSVPKKKFKHSVDRHRIRRLLLESWRLNKNLLYPVIAPTKQLHLFIMYTDTSMPEFEAMQTCVKKAIETFLKNDLLIKEETTIPTE